MSKWKKLLGPESEVPGSIPLGAASCPVVIIIHHPEMGPVWVL